MIRLSMASNAGSPLFGLPVAGGAPAGRKFANTRRETTSKNGKGTAQALIWRMSLWRLKASTSDFLVSLTKGSR